VVQALRRPLRGKRRESLSAPHRSPTLAPSGSLCSPPPPPLRGGSTDMRSHSRATSARAVTSRHDVTNEKPTAPKESEGGRAPTGAPSIGGILRMPQRALRSARSPLGAPPRLSVWLAPPLSSGPRFPVSGSVENPCGLSILSAFKLARHLADRSSCRPGRCPKPPGSGLQIRAQAPHPLRLQACLRRAPFDERDQTNVTDMVTNVKA